MADMEKVTDYTHYLVLPLKIVGCWQWYPRTTKEYQIIINNVYMCMVLFILTNLIIALIVNLYTEWTAIMESLVKIADGLPVIVSVFVVAYIAIYKNDLYVLLDSMNKEFVFHSAKGLTNMTMSQSYAKAKNFAYFYTACTLFSVTIYVTLPIFVHLWTKLPIQQWIYMDITRRPTYVIVFLFHAVGQAFVGLALGQLGVFFVANAILICGQLELLCCSLRNVRYTALLQHGVPHAELAAAYKDILKDEQHNYIYSKPKMTEPVFHFDRQMFLRLSNQKTQFDINSEEFDEATSFALRDCARICRIINAYKNRFERFVSPLLVLRVIQVTLYLCTLLYAVTLKFDMVTVEYLGAVVLDMFIYCYFGNQITLQADRVTKAVYQSPWHTMGVKPRRLLLNVLLSNKRPVVVRAGSYLPMDLHTFVLIIKTSFSYYTLLVNVNENKHSN